MKISNLISVTALSLIPFTTYAQSFSAHTEQSTLHLNEPFHLRLDFEGARSESAPDFSELKKSFQIVGQQESSVLKVINGRSTSSTIWDLTLLPMTVGSQKIPSITMSSNEGELKTAALSVDVETGALANTPQHNKTALSLVAKVSSSTPYKYERTLLQFEMPITRTLRNIDVGPLEIKDAIVDRQGEPKIETRNFNGRSRQVLSISFLLTPMKDGSLIIPPLVVHADVPASIRKTQRRPTPDILDSEEQDPFAQMQKMMQSFMQDDNFFEGSSPMRSIAISSQPLQLKVLAPVAGVHPWLPAKNLELTESWSGEARVGEPLSRVVTVKAEGLAPSQIPDLENELTSNQDFKIYKDQAVLSENIAQQTVISTKKNTFTIIPQKSGEIHMPAIQVFWWDAIHHVEKQASLPEKIISVSPFGPLGTGTPHQLAASSLSTSAKPDAPPRQQENQFKSELSKSPWFKNLKAGSIFIGLSACFIFTIGFLSIYFFKRKSQPVSQLKNQSPHVISKFRKEDFSQCKSVSEIQKFLQAYSAARWGTPPQASLAKIFTVAERHLRQFDRSAAMDILKRLEEDLYAQMPTDLVKLRKDIAHLIFVEDRKAQSTFASDQLLELNPS